MEALKFRINGCAALLVVCLSAAGGYAAIVEISVVPDAGGPGLHRYDMQINYADGLGFPGDPQPISGLLLLNAYTGFGVTASSNISAPTNWGFLPPFPDPLVDELDYFSFDPANDVPPAAGSDSVLGGFSFLSMRPPPTPFAPCPLDYSLDLIDDQGREIDPVCLVIPEPACCLMLGMLALISFRANVRLSVEEVLGDFRPGRYGRRR